MLPIPTHLKDILVCDENDFDGERLKGKIRCICGCSDMKLKILAEDCGENISVTDYKDGFGLRIVGICAECGKEFDLFDRAKHGYNGFVCHDGEAVEDTDLKPYACYKCGGDTFNVEMEFEIEDEEQFNEEVVDDAPDEYKPEDFVNAFDWISMSLTCKKCGEKIENWIDYETA